MAKLVDLIFRVSFPHPFPPFYFFLKKNTKRKRTNYIRNLFLKKQEKLCKKVKKKKYTKKEKTKECKENKEKREIKKALSDRAFKYPHLVTI